MARSVISQASGEYASIGNAQRSLSIVNSRYRFSCPWTNSNFVGLLIAKPRLTLFGRKFGLGAIFLVFFFLNQFVDDHRGNSGQSGQQIHRNVRIVP